ncbi:cGMP-dependent protein kinase 1 isoform X1 [Lucilia sericata]|uniref:cGMP-dependent protein kinase 1 isoform X1 n=1 Tax=Lucilia sericata TaxID=13632 RepID=UPI0018A8639C|nr:cGMP-dependent protein kinase 1 isoform X1 [Lucilia sericata]XP_037822243.1 cGMP-dependent protein kinase 1 isoform X1 [Lucilia sericata]
MACFPRFKFHARQKNSFTPEKDENKDTVLNNTDSTVQIGRYIRRDESAFFTPKASERLKPAGQRQSILTSHLNNNNRNSNNNNNHAKIAATSPAATILANGVNNSNKKFITKKPRSINNGQLNTNGLTNGTAAANAKHHPHPSQSSQKQNKLKPVKERRPTALPTEQPTIEGNTAAEHANDNKAKFFIGTHDEHDDTDEEDERKVSEEVLVVDFAEDCVDSKYASPNTSFSSKTFDILNAKLRNSKLPSNTSNKLSKFTRTPTNNSTLSSQHEVILEKDIVNIPPPPPLPPSPLVVAHSPSILSLKNSKSKRGSCDTAASVQQQPYAVAPSTPTIQEDAMLTSRNLTETEVHKASTATSTASSSLTASTHNGCAKLRKSAKFTLDEVLKHQIDDDSTSLTDANATTATTKSATSDSTARDSGVQVEESTPSPKDSDSSGDSPKSHRVEGGLIFTRANLPIKKDVQIEYIEKDEKSRNLIRTAIEKNDFLNNYMDKERKEMVIDAMELVHFKQNSFIINENDEGSEIYVSEEGSFDVIKQGQLIGNFGPCTVFGELAILYNAKRFASIRAATNASVWKIDRDKFRKIMVISGSKEREENLNFLRSAPFLNDLGEDVLGKVVDLLQRKFFETNTCIVKEGDIGNEFFIIRGGTVTIKKLNENGEERVVDRRKRGDYFGEQALLNADCRQASVYADAPGTEVLKLDREAFISYLGTIPQLRELPSESQESRSSDGNRKSEFDNEYANVELTDLKKIATLGSGAFGKVDLVSYDNKTFALKIIKKIDIVKQDQIEHVYSEKHVMMKCRSSPFIIELFKTFRNEKFVYFLMEACMGGDVWTVMSQRRFFDEKTARFIAGCVVEAFDFLHSHNIIYRDLKPENLMLTTDGYCKLVDFGFAKHIPTNQKTHTFAGTPEYVAPEIILDRGHDRSVDYWALGILIFELLVGKTPFRGQNQIKIYQQILGGIDVVQMPSKIPKSAQGLIKALCKQLPAERLGYQRKGILDIKRHSWFDSLDWQKLRNKQLPSPIKRPITSNTDLQYFGPSGVENDVDPPPETSGWDINF